MFHVRLRLTTLALALPALVGLAGCGGGGGSSATDPAQLVPATTPIYIWGDIRPTGAHRTDLNGALSKILDTKDVAGELHKQINKGLAQNGSNLTYERDVSPWLGQRAALFAVPDAAGGSDGAGLIETTNAKAAKTAFESQAKANGRTLEPRSYKGTDYTFESDRGNALAIVGKFVVVGKEAAVKAAIDTEKGETSSLADDSTYKDAIGSVPSNSVANLYVDIRSFIDKAAQARGPSAVQGIDLFKKVYGKLLTDPIVGSLAASAGGFQIQISLGAPNTPVASGSSKALGELPGSAFAAVAFPALGDQIKSSLDKLSSAGIPGFTAETLNQGFQSQLGLDLQSVLSSIGDAGIFAETPTPSTLSGAFVIRTTDAGGADKLVAGIEKAIKARGRVPVGKAQVSGGTGFSVRSPSFPEPVNIIAADGKVVVGVGKRATEDALSSQAPLSQSPDWGPAVSQLGSDLTPTGFLAIQPAIQYAEAHARATGKTLGPSFARAKRYLNHLEYLIYGTGRKGDRVLIRAALGLN